MAFTKANSQTIDTTVKGCIAIKLKTPFNFTNSSFEPRSLSHFAILSIMTTNEQTVYTLAFRNANENFLVKDLTFTKKQNETLKKMDDLPLILALLDSANKRFNYKFK